MEVELAAARSDPSLLAKPVVIAVPSESLRLHVAAKLVERAGRAVAGVSIVTLHQLALRILQRAGEQVPPGAALMPLLVRDLARAEPLLRDRLDKLVDGYGAVEASVADLLDAGMEAVHAEGLDERLEDSAAARGSSQIARAVVRLTGRVANTLESQELGSRSHALRRAAELLQEDPSVLVARAVFVHGFSDATGRACDLIVGLLRFHAACVLIDEPPDPSTGEPLEAFVSHFRQRLESWGRTVEAAREPVAGGLPSCLVAPGAEAEVRAVALRVAALLRDGASPEGVAVVARDLSPYATQLRTHFDRLGVPFSGLAPIACGGALARKLSALVDLLRHKQHCAADRWQDALDALDALDAPNTPNGVEAPGVEQSLKALAPDQRADLRLGLRHLGAARLAEVSALVDRMGRLCRPGLRQGVALPARRGLDEGREDGGSDATDGAAVGLATSVATRRRLSAALLTAACVAARRALSRLAAGAPSGTASFAQHAETIRSLASRDLGWPSDAPESKVLVDALDSLVNDTPPVEIAFDDFAHLLARNLAEAGAEPLGGAGGGVQVLSVVEARARTFGHLFVLGMNRDVFPRGIREDPLLGDSLRRNLAEMLPDIPIKRRGYDEERHLFAQLLASSPHVTLSWQSAADDGKARAPSTLVERLRWGSSHGSPQSNQSEQSEQSEQSDWSLERVPAVRALQLAADSATPVPAHEHALQAALYGDREALSGALEVAYQERADALDAARLELPGLADIEAGRRSARPSARELARVRLAVIREFDTPPSASDRLGPYFGFVGPPRDPGDPRFARPYVTGLEQLARCPWKSFLERILRIEPVPDPIEALPEVNALMVGSVVHRVLERMVLDELPEQSAELHLAQLVENASVHSGVPFAWPGDPEVFALLREEAARVLALEGVGLTGLVEVLVAQAWPRLECARDLEWPTPETRIAVAAVELEGSVRVRLDVSPDGAPATPVTNSDNPDNPDDSMESIYFRADRVDWVAGELVLTDYKTGRPPSAGVRPETQRKHFAAAVRRGEQLQAVAYALATEREGAVGRYLYLQPEGDGGADRLQYRVEAGDAELRTAFERAARALLAARRAGSFAPRLVDSNGTREPALCGYCNVAEACSRGDSGARQRLAQWTATAAPETGSQSETALRALRAVWELPAPAPEAGASKPDGSRSQAAP